MKFVSIIRKEWNNFKMYKKKVHGVRRQQYDTQGPSFTLLGERFFFIGKLPLFLFFFFSFVNILTCRCIYYSGLA